jgi:2-polyprenyl-3-methyl-5-hydroxy-6-metoxy-1,4-benzoquinol methylase
MTLPFAREVFDYIIFADVLEHLYHPGKVLRNMRGYLKPGGRILCSIPNMLHASVMIPLLQGDFSYQDAGILDKTHIRFFTLQSVYQLMAQSGYRVESVRGTRGAEEIISQNREIFANLHQLMNPNIADSLYIYQFLIKAQLADELV